MTAHTPAVATVLLGIARVGSVLVLVPLLQILFGEHGAGPANAREWIYLALFPVGFALGYAAAWRWPLPGGVFSLACMAASLLVIGRTFDWQAYAVWAAVCIPGLLFIIAGWLRRARRIGR